jgi:hypothetical protein
MGSEKNVKKILFLDEKNYGIDGVYNSQHDRIWVINRAEADKRTGVEKNEKFSRKLWFGWDPHERFNIIGNLI